MKKGFRFRHILAMVWKHKYFWTIAIFVVVVGFLDENSFWNKYKLREENDQTAEEIKKYEDKYHHDELKLKQLKSDPQALIRVAREDHQMKSPDEDVYYITYADSAESAAGE
ncbi:MAG: septum formation initiator family protein [Bacteroidales bacterium]|nr:septum formation initiator family protein [Bacteroidales bacterium]